MIVRIVRMTFQEDKVKDFLQLFNETKERIRHFEGCQHLTLLQDAHKPHIFSTYSHWESEQDLNKYRDSALFGEVWPATKALFADKPLAFSSTIHTKME
ncbi:antibiotic biosynthesis monooxygenase family protein [Cytophagales bacterium LB-30]|uniref:Antibiotic biosynthesis monooxygenase family protein n=1 Tax=Shiella aurantiaca TaxID=3058365 RepID=A0ABT8F8F7_9BACT|nr:antibiotic biosynthesis monooxygenase family protein [Shiella aurantiaca]MDN4166529.1 antibiotic biosynthesis monooxygenase family protein [Shiella aurantiaca]